MKKLILSILALVSLPVFSQTQTPAFPTAEGFGKWATGGRGGQVVEVTNTLDDAGGTIVGSLRWAFKQYSGQPITIVFRTSGLITLVDKLRSSRSNVTIAGQTAPGDGICIKYGMLNLGGSYNIIMRGLRMRIGSEAGGTNGGGTSLDFENGGNFIIDHCSVSWSEEELCDFYDDLNQTIQWCIFSEGLYAANHIKGSRGYGPVIGGRNTSFHHNLIASNVSRSPRFGTVTKNDQNLFIDFVNNINYNYGKANSCYGGENKWSPAGTAKINLVNNYYKPGPAYPGTSKAYFFCPSYNTAGGTTLSHFYVNGNYMEGTANTANNKDNWNGIKLEEYQKNLSDTLVAEDFKMPHYVGSDTVKTESAADAFNSVLANCGAIPLDTVDRRAIYQTRTGTATVHGTYNNNRMTGIIDSVTNVGGYPEYKTYNVVADTDHDGMPDYWETANGLDPNNYADHNNLSAEGYTMLEIYLNSLFGEKINGYHYPAPVYDTSSVKATKSDDDMATAYYGIDGTSRQQLSKGVNLVLYQNMNGQHQTKKILKK